MSRIDIQNNFINNFCLLEGSKINFKEFFDQHLEITEKLFTLLEESFLLDPNMSYGGARRTYYHHPDEEFLPHKDIYIYLLLSRNPFEDSEDSEHNNENSKEEVTLDDIEIIAFMGLKDLFIFPEKEYEIHISHVFVNPAYRQLGIASQMIPYLKEKAKEINPKSYLVWTASITNIPSQKLALKMGFEEVKKYTSNETGKPNQNPETILSIKYRST